MINEDDISDIEKFTQELRARVKEERERQGYSLTAFAKACGIPKSTYEGAEKGTSDFTLKRLLKAAKVLNMNIFSSGQAEEKEDNGDETALVAINEQSIAAMFIENKEQTKEMKQLKEEMKEMKELLKLFMKSQISSNGTDGSEG